MTRLRLLVACVAAVVSVSALADNPTTKPDDTTKPAATKPAATPPSADGAKAEATKVDTLTGTVDPYNADDQKVKFLKAAGRSNEMDAKAFEADRKAGGGAIMAFEKWETAIAFDENKNGKLDWFEFVAYRQAMRKAVLAACDKNKDDKLTGDERVEALRLLTESKLVIKPEVIAARGGARAPMFAVADIPTASAPAGRSGADVTATMHGHYISLVDQATTLSDEQKQKISEQLEANDKEYKEFKSQHDQRIQELNQTLRNTDPHDKDKAEALLSEFRKARDAPREFQQKQQARVMELLTAEQRLAWRTAQVVRVGNMAIYPAKLDDQQVEKLIATFADQLKDETFEPLIVTSPYLASVDPYREYRQQVTDVVESLLTEDQKEQAAMGRVYNDVGSRFSFASLTEEQTKELWAAYNALKKSGVTSQEAAAKLSEKALSLLTADQKDRAISQLLMMRLNADDRDPGIVLSDEQKKTLRSTYEEMDKAIGGGLPVSWNKFTPFIGMLSAAQKDEMILKMTAPRSKTGQ